MTGAMTRTFALQMLMALGLLAGCASQQPRPAAEAPPDGPVQPKVQRVIVALESVPGESNDMRMIAGPNSFLMQPMYEAAVDMDPKTAKYIPWLASDWQLDEKENTYSFHLRKGVRFHRGWGEMTAKDIITNIRERMTKEDSAGTVPAYWRNNLKEQLAPDDYTWLVKLKQPESNLFDQLSRYNLGAVAISSKELEQKGPPTMQDMAQAGTGPYEFGSRQEGAYLRMKRVDYKHWRMTPDFPELEVRFMKEASTRLAALLTKEVHLTPLPEDLLRQAQLKGFKVIKGPVPAFRLELSWTCCLYKDVSRPELGYVNPDTPLADIRVRKLLSKAVNRDELNKALFGGKGEIMVNNPMHPTRLGWSPDWEKRFPEEYGYDAAKARALLAEAGYTAAAPLKVNLVVTAANGVTAPGDIIEAVGNYWRAIGIQVDLVTPPNPDVLRRYDNHIRMWGTSSLLWSGSNTQGSAIVEQSRVSNINIYEADEILKEISRTFDEKKLDELWRKEGNIFFDQHKFLPLFWLPVEIVANGEIVSDYIFPGSATGNWTHLENIKAAR